MRLVRTLLMALNGHKIRFAPWALVFPTTESDANRKISQTKLARLKNYLIYGLKGTCHFMGKLLLPDH